MLSRSILSGALLSLVLLSCGGPRATTTATVPYAQLLRNAAAAERAGDLLEAADNYRQAYELKPKKQDLLFQAAELYTRVRAYRPAADAYTLLAPDEVKWPLLGLRLGRALKQDGRYEQARRELARFLESYNGADRPIVTEIVRNELAGITLAREAARTEQPVDVDRPGRGINTGADEFGAVALAGEQLLFTSTAGGEGRLYQSRLVAREWTKATVPPGFPVIAEGEFGTGSMSPDGRVFFFSICSGLTGEDATNRCEIFRGERSVNGVWSQPEALGEQINLEGGNNAFPGITVNPQGLHVLYFASDRPGGRGGMDLYVSTQIDAANPLSFGSPMNLGPAVNTVSDEITPYYDPEQGILYFASNGHPGFGGLDVFRTTVQAGNYSRPENLGLPVNSAADDYGLSLTPGTGSGYLTSNRTFAGEKAGTTETDIFSLNFRAGRAKLKATVYDNSTGEELGGAEVTLLELGPDGGTREVDRRIFPSGVYTFDLRPGNRYRVLIRREGYQGVEYQVETGATGSSLYGQPVFLRRQAIPAPPEPGTRLPNSPAASDPGPGLPDGSPETAPTVTPAPSPAPAAAPTAYRIQISAARRLVPTDGRYESVRAIGHLTSEPIPGRTDLVRITVGYFTDEAAAEAALRQVQRNGFDTAFAVRYDNGVRYGRVRL